MRSTEIKELRRPATVNGTIILIIFKPKYLGGRQPKAVEIGDLQKLFRVTTFVPLKHEAGTVWKKLSWQNPDFQVNTWWVKGSKGVPSKKSDLGIETAVLVSMESTEIEALECIDLLPYCGGFSVHCLV